MHTFSSISESKPAPSERVIDGRFATQAPPKSSKDPKLSAQQSFALTLGMKSDVLERGGTLTKEQQARQVAEQLVASTFVLPMLKLFRDSNHAAPPFAPTPAEKQFGGLMDTELAQRIVTAKHFPIVDSVAKRLLEKAKSDAPGQDAKKEMEKASREAQMSRLMTNSDSIAKSSMAIPLGVPKAQAPSIPTIPAAPQP